MCLKLQHHGEEIFKIHITVAEEPIIRNGQYKEHIKAIVGC